MIFNAHLTVTTEQICEQHAALREELGFDAYWELQSRRTARAKERSAWIDAAPRSKEWRDFGGRLLEVEVAGEGDGRQITMVWVTNPRGACFGIVRMGDALGEQWMIGVADTDVQCATVQDAVEWAVAEAKRLKLWQANGWDDLWQRIAKIRARRDAAAAAVLAAA